MSDSSKRRFSDPIGIGIIRRNGKIIYGNEEIAKRMDNDRKAQKALAKGDIETYEKLSGLKLSSKQVQSLKKNPQ